MSEPFSTAEFGMTFAGPTSFARFAAATDPNGVDLAVLGVPFDLGTTSLDIVGADLVEVSPPFHHAGITAVAGATLALDELYLLAGAGERRL